MLFGKGHLGTNISELGIKIKQLRKWIGKYHLSNNSHIVLALSLELNSQKAILDTEGLSQITKTLLSMSIRYQSDMFVSVWYLIHIDPWVFAIWDEAGRYTIYHPPPPPPKKKKKNKKNAIYQCFSVICFEMTHINLTCLVASLAPEKTMLKIGYE